MRIPFFQTAVSAAVIASFALTSAPSEASEIIAGVDARTGMEVVIYPGDLALVSERRTAEAAAGDDLISLPGAAARLNPESILIDIVPADAAQLVSQRFDGDVLSLGRMLAYNIGREVFVTRNLVNTGPERGTLLTRSDPALVQTERGVEIVDAQNLIFSHLPTGITADPRVQAGVQLLSPPAEGTTVPLELGLSYLTGGLNWRATYVGRYDEAAGTLRLSAAAHLENRSGLELKAATVRVVAGDMNRLVGPVMDAPVMRAAPMMAEAAVSDMSLNEPAARVSVSGYHVYGPFKTVDLGQDETMDLTLFPAADVSVDRMLRFTGASWRYLRPQRSSNQIERPEIRLSFDNTSEAGVGVPLPQGRVRIYGNAPDGAALLLGEDEMTSTAIAEEVALTLGRDFDVGAKRRQTDYDLHNQGRDKPRVHTSSHEITFTNAKDKPVEIEARERFSGEWEILDASAEFERLDAEAVVWTLTVPAGEEVVLDYTVRVIQ
jgi:hypothetical protein